MLRSTINQALLHASAKPVVWLLCLAPLAFFVQQALADTLGANPAEAIIRNTGNWSLRMLCVALAMTPLRKLSGLNALARMRRLLGLFAFFYAVLHAASYVWLDMNWQWHSVWDDVLQRPFILVGVIAVAILSLLALTSPKAALKAIGGVRWQHLHRSVYLAALLAVLHFYWIRLGKNNWMEVGYYAAIIGMMLLVRVYGWRKQHRKWAQQTARGEHSLQQTNSSVRL